MSSWAPLPAPAGPLPEVPTTPRSFHSANSPFSSDRSGFLTSISEIRRYDAPSSSAPAAGNRGPGKPLGLDPSMPPLTLRIRSSSRDALQNDPASPKANDVMDPSLRVNSSSRAAAPSSGPALIVGASALNAKLTEGDSSGDEDHAPHDGAHCTRTVTNLNSPSTAPTSFDSFDKESVLATLAERTFRDEYSPVANVQPGLAPTVGIGAPAYAHSIVSVSSSTRFSHLPDRPLNPSDPWKGRSSHPFPPAALSPLQASLAFSLARLLSRNTFDAFLATPAGFAQFHNYLSRTGGATAAVYALELWKDLDTLKSTTSRSAMAAKAIQEVHFAPENATLAPFAPSFARDTGEQLTALSVVGLGLEKPSRHLLNTLYANEFHGFIRHRLLQHTRAQLSKYELTNDERSGLGDVFCLTNPRLPDAPIVLASPAFCALTGYAAHQIIGRNCRFLQGQATAPESVQAIRTAIDNEEPITQLLLNYTASGAPFWNLLCILPLRDAAGELMYFIGGQTNLTGAIAAGSGEDLSFVLSSDDTEGGPVIDPGSYTDAVESNIFHEQGGTEPSALSPKESMAPKSPSTTIPSFLPSPRRRYTTVEPAALSTMMSCEDMMSGFAQPAVTKRPSFLSLFSRSKGTEGSGSSKSKKDQRQVPAPLILAPVQSRTSTVSPLSRPIPRKRAASVKDVRVKQPGIDASMEHGAAPIEKKLSDFQMTYERVVVLRADNRKILFVTSGFLRYLGLPGASFQDVDTSKLVHLDLLNLVKATVHEPDQKKTRQRIKTTIEEGVSGSLRCALSFRGPKVEGTLHLSPLKNMQGDVISFVGVFA
ncbi:BZ3500_MvSof-1268-A1-R1_Chr7-1g09114 [Microbotryum saponariae]|uniref:BZ3500_MvSof-1268-A1-R1_Chr7-1g09114 protein n=1 Tax=Microbotryum saponariae TaxID=289078 RepID=A0A2X0LHG4_9BASI|nr:BZ3501_MvSof-1269-A2-R1_Chr7-1g08819 [Microbotryum saponariae]SDA02828.1 BZ3500_MvSof-1268-A1-R1_Chr7-1g09114 [Microbotryum saponariae]